MPRAPRFPTPEIYFSPRERQVLGLVCLAYCNKQIAAELRIAVGTVKLHVSSLLRKLRLSDRAELMVWGLQNPEDLDRGCTSKPGLHRLPCDCGVEYCTVMARVHREAA